MAPPTHNARSGGGGVSGWIRKNKLLAGLLGAVGIFAVATHKGHAAADGTSADGTGASTGAVVLPVSAGGTSGSDDSSGGGSGSGSSGDVGSPGEPGPPGEPGAPGEPGPAGEDAAPSDTTAGGDVSSEPVKTAAGKAKQTTTHKHSPGGSSAKHKSGGAAGHGGKSGHGSVGHGVTVLGHHFAGASSAAHVLSGKNFTQYNIHSAGKVEKVNFFHSGPKAGQYHVVSTTPSHQHASHAPARHHSAPKKRH